MIEEFRKSPTIIQKLLSYIVRVRVWGNNEFVSRQEAQSGDRKRERAKPWQANTLCLPGGSQQSEWTGPNTVQRFEKRWCNETGVPWRSVKNRNNKMACLTCGWALVLAKDRVQSLVARAVLRSRVIRNSSMTQYSSDPSVFVTGISLSSSQPPFPPFSQPSS